MKRSLALLLAAACSGHMTPPDAGPPDSGPARFCVGSICDAAGTWRVTFAGDAGNLLCRPVSTQIILTSDGSTVCMLDAVDGGTDGGCGLTFSVEHQQSGIHLDDIWDIGLPDAGHMYGTWSTHVTGSATCDGVFSIHGVR